MPGTAGRASRTAGYETAADSPCRRSAGSGTRPGPRAVDLARQAVEQGRTRHHTVDPPPRGAAVFGLSPKRFSLYTPLAMRWTFAPTLTPPDGLETLAERLEISPDLAVLLYRRGMQDAETLAGFLNPRLAGLAPPAEWPGLEQAGRVAVEALAEGRTPCVWGDYDVDGITSTVLLKDFFRRRGIACRTYIPHRLHEGYGLNIPALENLAGEGVNFLITVDSGATDVEAVARAKELGMRVIVTDHHLPGPIAPPADAVINPRSAPCPCPALAGVGVAFFLAAAVNAELAKRDGIRLDMRDFLDLVALGTLADVVDLGGQNRILVKNGLLKIAEGARVGVAALKSACNHAPTAALGAGQVVFNLAPRLNAAGRLGSTELALELLLTDDRATAAQLAGELSRLNAERRAEEDLILAKALEQGREQAEAGRTGLVLYGEDWHPGIIGIVASRMVEALHRPTVVISRVGPYLKGSGRSVPGFDLHAAFAASEDLLLGFGGHRQAAGLSMEPDNLHSFRERFAELALQGIGAAPEEPECRIDGELSLLKASDFTFLKELELLQPFGNGNPEPIFASPPVLVKAVRRHPGFCRIEVQAESGGPVLHAKAWRRPTEIPLSLKGTHVRLAYTPRIDRYNGAAQVELRLKDWKPA